MPLSPDPEVIVFNLKKRFSGVSATIHALVPIQLNQWRLGYCGPDLSAAIPGVRLRDAIAMSRTSPNDHPFRIWHVRRDHEMMVGIWARDVLKLPIRLVFTSAAQHRHSWFPRWLISRMDAVIATTTKAASFVPNVTAVIPHGVDLTRFHPPPDKFAAWAESGLPGKFGIGIFGRVRPSKGTDLFVEAMIKTLPAFSDATAIITGLAAPQYKAFENELKAKIAAAGLAGRIIFLGELPFDEVRQWLRRCLIAVACPRYEPFGLTPFEAAASGCALICSRTGAFEELVIPGENGLLLEPGDLGDLQSALEQLLQSTSEASRMGQAARTKVLSDFDLKHEARSIGDVYMQLFRSEN